MRISVGQEALRELAAIGSNKCSIVYNLTRIRKHRYIRYWLMRGANCASCGNNSSRSATRCAAAEGVAQARVAPTMSVRQGLSIRSVALFHSPFSSFHLHDFFVCFRGSSYCAYTKPRLNEPEFGRANWNNQK